MKILTRIFVILVVLISISVQAGDKDAIVIPSILKPLLLDSLLPGYNCGSYEADLANDEQNCGACAVTCGIIEACSSGRCQCGATMGVIGGGSACGTMNCCPATGCVDLQSDPQNCGACNVACQIPPASCSGGEITIYSAACFTGQCGSSSGTTVCPTAPPTCSLSSGILTHISYSPACSASSSCDATGIPNETPCLANPGYSATCNPGGGCSQTPN